MFWDRDRLLLALSTKKLVLSSKPQSHAGLLYKSYVDFYGINFLDSKLVEEQSVQVVPSVDFDLVVQNFKAKTSASENQQQNALILHGYFDHVGIYKHLIGHLLEKGINVTAFDLPGHGLSSGKRAAIQSFTQYQQVLRSVMRSQLDPKSPTFLIGQSTGAAILADALSSEEGLQSLEAFNIRSSIFLAPLLKPVAWGKAEFLHTLLAKHKTTWPRNYRNNSHDEAFVAFIRDRDPLQHDCLSVEWVGALRKWLPDMLYRDAHQKHPISIIQGTEDTTIDWQYSLKRYQRLFPNCRAIKIDGAGHHLVGESEEFRVRVFEALDQALI